MSGFGRAARTGRLLHACEQAAARRAWLGPIVLTRGCPGTCRRGTLCLSLAPSAGGQPERGQVLLAFLGGWGVPPRAVKLLKAGQAQPSPADGLGPGISPAVSKQSLRTGLSVAVCSVIQQIFIEDLLCVRQPVAQQCKMGLDTALYCL